MSPQPPLKLLELTLISAQDLPPVSKLLRTYAVAWLHPDHKLNTRVDHYGHTHPTWNYKLLFPLHHDHSTFITIEIYNVGMLRDIPIGTTRFPLTNLLSPPPTKPISLQISRPSGHLQGTLNVSYNLIDTHTPTRSMPLYSQLTSSTGTQKSNTSIYGLQRTRSQTNTTNDDFSYISEVEMNKKGMDLNGSIWSGMKPLPSVVAGDDMGSSIFEGWSDGNSKLKVFEWVEDDHIPLVTAETDGGGRRRSHRQTKSEGGGLFSCFGKAYGFEFTLMCGSNGGKKNRKKLLGKNKTVIDGSHSEQSLDRLYV